MEGLRPSTDASISEIEANLFVSRRDARTASEDLDHNTFRQEFAAGKLILATAVARCHINYDQASDLLVRYFRTAEVEPAHEVDPASDIRPESPRIKSLAAWFGQEERSVAQMIFRRRAAAEARLYEDRPGVVALSTAQKLLRPGNPGSKAAVAALA